MKRIYICEVCEEEFDLLERAERCESTKLNEPKFKVGDKVYLVPRYASTEKKPFVERTVTKVKQWGHQNGYELNETVQVSKDSYAGCFPLYQQDSARPAIESDFYIFGKSAFVYNNFLTEKEVLCSQETVDFD
jgi:hypothetical protein